MKGRKKGEKYVPAFDKQRQVPLFHGSKKDLLKDVSNSPNYLKWSHEKADIEWKILHGDEIYHDITHYKLAKRLAPILFKSEEELDVYIKNNHELFNPRYLSKEKVPEKKHMIRGWRNKRKVSVLETGEIFNTPRDCWYIYPTPREIHASLKTGNAFRGLHFVYVD